MISRYQSSSTSYCMLIYTCKFVYVILISWIIILANDLNRFCQSISTEPENSTNPPGNSTNPPQNISVLTTKKRKISLRRLFSMTYPTVNPISEEESRNYEPAVLEAENNHSVTVIFIHGFGGTGVRWVKYFKPYKEPYMKIMFPTAERKPIIPFSDWLITTWYDNAGIEKNTSLINDSTNFIHNMIEEEIKAGIHPNRIFLSGYAQGGTVATHSAVTYPKKLGGLLLINTYFPESLRKVLNETHHPASKTLPIWQTDHSPILDLIFDPVTAVLKNISNNVYIKLYEFLDKTLITPEQLTDFHKFVTTNIAEPV